MSTTLRPTRRAIVLRAARFILVVMSANYLIALAIYLILRVAFGDQFWWLALINNFMPFIFLPLIVLLPLVFALRNRWLLALAALLAVIGVVLFGPYYLPKAHSATSGSTLRIVTFNISDGNQRIADVEAWLRQTDADIVFMQENADRYLKQGVPALKDMYQYQFAQDRRWGSIILSRYPFITMDSFSLEGDGYPTQQRITISVNGQTIALYNIHLVMPIGDKPHFLVDQWFLRTIAYYDDNARNAEISRLLDKLKTESVPVLVAGDFNTSDQAATYQALGTRMGDTFREVGTGLGASWPVNPTAGYPAFVPPLIRIDYIWHSAHFRAIDAQQGPILGSDHLPLYATLELVK